MTSCMPPASSKKRSSTMVSWRGQGAERGVARGEIVHELLRRGLAEPTSGEPGEACPWNSTRSLSPSPLGEGFGWVRGIGDTAGKLATPLPNPPPRGRSRPCLSCWNPLPSTYVSLDQPLAISVRRRETDCESSSLRPGASPSQNGMVGAMPLRVLDANDAALDPPDPIALVAELEDVARQALDGEVLVQGADELILGLEQNLIIGVVGNGAA